MSGYTIAVFFHTLGVIVLFGGIMIQQRVAARLRSATTLQEVRLWMGFLRSAAGMPCRHARVVSRVCPAPFS